MIDLCLIIGDSIAVGVSMIRKECISYAKSGWNSAQWNKDYLQKAAAKQYETVVISLGANDLKNIRTELELRKMRETIKGKRVFWISPGMERKPIAQTAIEKIAAEYNDTVLARPAQHMSGDGVHPTMKGYRELAEKTR
jgi:lysophospholipase L1-like esterase